MRSMYLSTDIDVSSALRSICLLCVTPKHAHTRNTNNCSIISTLAPCLPLLLRGID